MNKNKKIIENNVELNLMNKLIRLELKEIKNKKWSNFANNINNNPLASKKCWKRINDIKNHGIKKDENYPKMKFNNKEYKTDKEKADLFGSIIGEIFKDNEDEKFDRKFKLKVEKEVNDYLDDKGKNNNIQHDLINSKELSKIIKNLKTTLSRGEDKIQSIEDQSL